MTWLKSTKMIELALFIPQSYILLVIDKTTTQEAHSRSFFEQLHFFNGKNALKY